MTFKGLGTLMAALIAAAGSAYFAVANPGLVRVSFDALQIEAPRWTAHAPLFAIILAPFAVGVLVGGILAWSSAGTHRRELKQARKEIDRLRAVAAVRPAPR